MNNTHYVRTFGLLSVLLWSLSSLATAQDVAKEVSCVPHDYSDDQWDRGRTRPVNFPTNIGVAPGSVQVSCVQLYNIPDGETHTIKLQRPQYQYRINDGQWQRHDTQGTFNNNDRIYIRTTAELTKGTIGESYLFIDGGYSSSWRYQVENTPRAPKTWQVGPNRNDQQLSEIQDQLVAGDIVELDGDATYEAVEFTRAGLEDAPITIRGVLVNGQRPIISGNISNEKQWTMAFNQSHYYLIDNLEITGGSEICLRNMAHQVTISNTYIHHCENHGVIGSDEYSGTLTLNHVEVAHVGNGLRKHAIYVATDGHRFPGSKLRIENSYIHDFRGNGVKSRAFRTEFLFNWVEQSDWVNPRDLEDHSYYSLELIGPDGYEPDEPLEQLVVGNVFVHKLLEVGRNSGTYGMRFGGDGTGYSWGKVWFTDNIVISPEQGQDAIFRTQYRINSVYLKNNLFMRADSPAEEWQSLRLFNNSAENWYTNDILIHGENNWYPADTVIDHRTQIPARIRTQWQRNNHTTNDISELYFDSDTGVIQLPANNTILNGDFNTSENLDSHYQLMATEEYNGEPYSGYLIRP